MSLFGPVTDSERRGWQRRDALALVDLLADAHKADLPPIVWQVGATGGLLGRCLTADPSARRAEFEAWAAFLAPVSRWPEHTHAGRTHLHATRERTGAGVEVVVIADLYDEPTEVDR